MNILKNQRSIVAGGTAFAMAALIFSASALPAQAKSYDWLNWQPQVGDIHRQEIRLERQLKNDYRRGYIDANEFAQLQRDLDGIQVCEDEFRMDHNGLGEKDVKGLKGMLNRFQDNLNRETADKGCFAQVVVNR